MLIAFDDSVATSMKALGTLIACRWHVDGMLIAC
jgi:hypothetical protein